MAFILSPYLNFFESLCLARPPRRLGTGQEQVFLHSLTHPPFLCPECSSPLCCSLTSSFLFILRSIVTQALAGCTWPRTCQPPSPCYCVKSEVTFSSLPPFPPSLSPPLLGTMRSLLLICRYPSAPSVSMCLAVLVTHAPVLSCLVTLSNQRSHFSPSLLPALSPSLLS